MTPATGRDIRPDMPGRAHGIKAINPPTIQCDGCAYLFVGPDMSWAVLYSGIEFNTRLHDHPDLTIRDRRRLCDVCRLKAGWK